MNGSGPAGSKNADSDSETQNNDTNTKSAAESGAAGASGSTDGKSKPNKGMDNPKMADEPLGEQTEFFSADTSAGGAAHGAERAASTAGGVAQDAAAPSLPAGTTPATAGKEASVATSVERGDIFRVLDDQRILNLNNYRGVQVLDVSDLSKPRVEGRLAVAGDPVEMYVVGDRAFVLLNNWQGYYGSRDDVKVHSASGGLVMSVDIHDRAHPTLIDQAEVNGNILTSRLTQGNGQAALFVAASVYDGQAHSLVKSFEVSSGKLMAKSELDLGGQVSDVQATTGLMMVASIDYSQKQQRSTVSVIDISRSDGTMLQGGSVQAQGVVQDKFKMDAYKGVLRVASGASWNGSLENHLETFSLSDLNKLTPIDDCKLGQRDTQNGANEQLYATVFVENRAFLVTYYRQDPFHAFSIDDAGQCTEHNEFIVSGWNDYLRATLGNTRLLGVGTNDLNNTRMLSVSLYDAVNLSNPNPLLARADIELNGAYSEATWDDRAFSVLEDAVSVNAKDGTQETGLVLVPYSGWDTQNQRSISQVQLFTFSDHTLTKRGTMDHGSPVRRSFEVEADTTGNLSDDQLSLFDTGDPDQPHELGRVDVAPSYSRVFVYGDHVARVRDSLNYGYAPQSGMTPPPNHVQVVAADGDVDANPVLASFDVPAGATLTQVGELLVSVYTDTTYDASGQNPKSHSQVQVFDLSDPLKPKKRGALETDRLQPSYGGRIYPGGPIAVKGGVACFDCIYPRPQIQSYVVGEAIVFPNTTAQQKSLGFVTQCDTYPVSRDCSTDKSGQWSCDNPYYSGGITCITPDGGDEQCTGEFYLCDDSTGDCKPTDTPAFTNRNCNHYEQFRYWQSYTFDTLDLRDADAPRLADRVELPSDEEGTSLITAGDSLYFNFQQPYHKKDDSRSYVKHYVRMLGFGDPQKPSIGDPINIPGDVIAAMGSTLYTRDFVWKDNDARTLVARLTVKDGAAHLQASELFEDRQVSAVELDGAGHVLVSSDPVYTPVGPIARPAIATATTPGSALPAKAAGVAVAAPQPDDQPKSRLSILDAQDLSTLGEADIDSWATFRDAKGGRALYQVPGGLLVIDVHDAQKPAAQAYFPVMGWPSDIVFDGDSILFAAGMYGVYRLDADVFNLLMQ